MVEARQLSLQAIEAEERGETAQAGAMFAKAVTICPNCERSRTGLAESLWKQGNRTEAISQMHEAVRLVNNAPDKLVRLGEMHLGQQQYDEALSCAERAIRQKNCPAEGFALRGNIHMAAGRDQEALADYHRSLAYQPHQPATQIAIAEIYRRQNRPTRTLATMDSLASQCIGEEIPSRVFVLQGLALKQLGRYDAAAQKLSAARDRGETSMEVLANLADAQWIAGKQQAARETLAQATESDPNSPVLSTLRAKFFAAEPGEQLASTQSKNITR